MHYVHILPHKVKFTSDTFFNKAITKVNMTSDLKAAEHLFQKVLLSEARLCAKNTDNQ